MESLIAACVAFVGTHFLLSHPLRAGLVARMGPLPFQGLYSVVALATFAWIVIAYRAIDPQPPLWPVGDALWAAATAAMLVGSVLFAGSLIGNPALPGMPLGAVPEAEGVFAITRHPMMWGFALWGLVHIAVNPTPKSIILSKTIVVLALLGSYLQDRKKARLQPDFWREWSARTSYWPFVRGGRFLTSRGWIAIVVGTALWLALSWAHIPFSGWPAGVWRWIG